MKKTKAPREYTEHQCGSCGLPYNAAKKIYGKGFIGAGLCPNCVSESKPKRTAVCPFCEEVFPIQAGHARTTCSRDCQKGQTLLNRAEKLEQAGHAMTRFDDKEGAATQADKAAELRRQASELLEAKRAKNRVKAEKAAAEQSKGVTERQMTRRRRSDSRAAQTAQVQQRTNEITKVYQEAGGTRLNRLSHVAGALHERRLDEAVGAA